MSEILTVINNSLPLFSTLGIVLLLRVKGVLKAEYAKNLSPVIFKLVLPIFVFNALYGVEVEIDDFPIIASIVLVHVLIMAGFAFYSRWQNYSKAFTGTILMMVMAYSVGPVVYPFVELNFDTDVFAKVVLIDMFIFVSLMIIAPVVGSIYNPTNKFSLKATIKNIVTDPILIAVLIAAVLNALNITLPQGIKSTVDYIGAPFIFLVTVFVALTLNKPKPQRLKLITVITGLRFLLAVLIAGLVVMVFTTSVELAAAVFLTLFTAFSAFPIAYTDRNDLDSELVAQLSIFSRIAAYILFPIVIVIVKNQFNL